jgi:hypothetical protein
VNSPLDVPFKVMGFIVFFTPFLTGLPNDGLIRDDFTGILADFTCFGRLKKSLDTDPLLIDGNSRVGFFLDACLFDVPNINCRLLDTVGDGAVSQWALVFFLVLRLPASFVVSYNGNNNRNLGSCFCCCFNMCYCFRFCSIIRSVFV